MIKELKQVILVRKDLELPPGKLAAQVAHACVEAMVGSSKLKVARWRVEGAKKVVLEVEDLKELMRYCSLAQAAKLRCALIRDAGRTVIAAGTVTCLGIGPDESDKIDKITGKLRML
jgi:PTH2 family peptidyl-tRNA hydrolase